MTHRRTGAESFHAGTGCSLGGTPWVACDKAFVIGQTGSVFDTTIVMALSSRFSALDETTPVAFTDARM
jgi:hypothetical protein